MRNLGRLLTALNPLDQSAISQIRKASSASGGMGQMLGLAYAGAKQVLGGGYFKGKTLSGVNGRLRSLTPGNIGGAMEGVMMDIDSRAGRTLRTVALGGRKERGNIRKMAAGGLGAWAGLNVMAPDSNLTTAANIAVVGGAAVGAAAHYGRPAYSKWMGA